MVYRLGIDVGGVIIDRKRNDKGDTSLMGPKYKEAYAVEGALDAIRDLNAGRFKDLVYIVSKCGQNVQRKTREWMAYNRFHEITGVPLERVFFCFTRAEKAPICERLGLTHFVDDRLEVLSYLKSVPNQYLFGGDPKEVERWTAHKAAVTAVDTWSQLSEILKG